MLILETIAVAFSMYSAIPMPVIEWNQRNMRYAMCAFPLIGVVIGAVCSLVWSLCTSFGLHELVRGALMCVLPVLLTGGIHLDGFSDTEDALASHAGPEKRQAILKDPHIGSFALIRVCCYFVVSFSLWTALPTFGIPEGVLSFCLSRTLSGLSIASFPLARQSGLAYTFAEAADRQRVKRLLSALALMLAVGLCSLGVRGIAMTVAAGAVFLFYRRMSVKEFGGLSGDLAGWFLQMCELMMLIALFGAEWLGG